MHTMGKGDVRVEGCRLWEAQSQIPIATTLTRPKTEREIVHACVQFLDREERGKADNTSRTRSTCRLNTFGARDDFAREAVKAGKSIRAGTGTVRSKNLCRF